MRAQMARVVRIEAALGVSKAAPVPDGATDHLSWWSRPVAPGVFRDFYGERARVRLAAEGGPCWFTGITEAERCARADAEEAELDRLQAEYGDAEGWAVWLDQARFWPAGDQVTEDALERRLMHAFATADLHRTDHSAPLWRRVWPEWRAGMTLAEHIDFDRLLAEQGQARCRRVTVKRTEEWT